MLHKLIALKIQVHGYPAAGGLLFFTWSTGVCDAISLFDAVCVGLPVTIIISKKELATSVLNFRLE